MIDIKKIRETLMPKKKKYTYEELMQMQPDRVEYVTKPKMTAYLLPDLNTYTGDGNPFGNQLVITGYPAPLGNRTTKKFYASDILVALFSNLDVPVVDVLPPKPYRKIRSLSMEEVML